MTTRVAVIEAHKSNYPNPIRFQAGDRLTVGETDSQYGGWIRVTTGDGNQGWAPMQFVKVIEDTTGVALQHYDATELDTTIGERLSLHYELNGWGWVERTDGACGWVPMCTVKLDPLQG